MSQIGWVAPVASNETPVSGGNRTVFVNGTAHQGTAVSGGVYVPGVGTFWG
ncbi:MAG: hypothetical protein WBO29_12210 [Albidovulum sp.]